ncbi:DgyrCDS8709 [Dimorphilus gyrociliatus]|uniref:DgyrCDS8709 n=1 Tax=Dimorphilus gyrociliatus TaxID=2664684 RepID=A0A7I8VUW2_9ANNE|nr:DgyrCDS8709 [Dimorphilus gyrociliatus]
MVYGNKGTDCQDSANNYGNVEARLKTFKSKWPHKFISIRILAEAGFHFTGPDDRVQCFKCSGQLQKWVSTDDAFSEHRKHFPHCPFLKTQEFQRSLSSNADQEEEKVETACLCGMIRRRRTKGKIKTSSLEFSDSNQNKKT